MAVKPEKGFEVNLDPIVLFAHASRIEKEAHKVLDSFGTRPTDPKTTAPTHIFNLGHGIGQFTPPENVAVLVEAVHNHSRTKRAGR